jgi:hypothetical protein
MEWYWVHLILRPLFGLLYQPRMIDRWLLWRNRWNANWQGKLKYSEKTCPSATLSSTNPTWPDPGSNTGRRGGEPATNRLSYDLCDVWSVLISLCLCYHLYAVGCHHIDIFFNFTLYVSGWDHSQSRTPFEQQIPKCLLYQERVFSASSRITCANLVPMP